MRLFCRSALLGFLFLSLFGCYANLRAPAPQLAVKLDADSFAKSGSTTCAQVLWVFGNGDCSVHSAIRNGGLKKVHHVDSDIKIIFYGAYSEATVTAYGE